MFLKSNKNNKSVKLKYPSNLGHIVKLSMITATEVLEKG
jgi:hypothetical protein